MPIRSGHSQEVISANIGELIKAGHKRSQAAAIAYREAGKAAKDMKPEDWDGLVSGLVKFFSEEADEPEHAEDGWHVRLAADRAIGPFVSRDMAERARALALGPLPVDLAYDKSSARVYDKDGRLHLESTHISKAGVCPYIGHEIPGWQKLGLDPERVYQLLRDPKELEKAAPTFNGVPLMKTHVSTSADDPKLNDVVGSAGTSAVYNHPYLDNAISIWPQYAIDGVEDESKRELSCSYHYRPDMSPGYYEGTPYDGVMRDIVGNHVALVEKGRAGPDVLVGDEAIKQEQDMKVAVLSRTAARTQGALCAYVLPKLAADAMPKFAKALAPGLKDVTRKNLKEKRAAIVKLARDAAEPMMTPEAKASGGVGPDDVMMRILDLVGEQTEAEPAEMDEAQPGTVTDPSAAVAPAGAKAKVMEYLKAKGMDEASCKEVMDMMPEDAVEDESPAEKARKEKEALDKAAKDKESPKPGEPAGVTEKAMDAAIAKVRKETRDETLKTLADIRAAEKAVFPLIGEVGVAMDSASAIYAAALKANDIAIDGVDSSAFPAMVAILVKAKEAAKTLFPRHANDAALVTERQQFEKDFGITPSRVRNLGA